MTHRDVDIPLKKDVQIANRPKRIRKPYFLLGQFVFMILFTIKELSILLLINYIYRYCHLFFLNKEALLHDSNNLFYITRYLPERFPQGRCGANPVFNVGFSQRVWSGKNSPYTPHTRIGSLSTSHTRLYPVWVPLRPKAECPVNWALINSVLLTGVICQFLNREINPENRIKISKSQWDISKME